MGCEDPKAVDDLEPQWAWPVVILICSLLTLIPLVWPSLSLFEHSLPPPAAAGAAELRLQALSPLLFHPSSCQACLGQLPAPGQRMGLGMEMDVG